MFVQGSIFVVDIHPRVTPGTNNFDVSIRDISMLGTSVLEEEETPRRGGVKEGGSRHRKGEARRLRLKSIKRLFGDKSKKSAPISLRPKRK